MHAARRPAGFRLLDHTADIGIEAWGATFSDLFEQAALGLRFLLVGDSPVSRQQHQAVSLEAADSGELMVTWLNELIFLFETQNLVPQGVRFEQLDAEILDARVYGETYTPERHHVEHQVKAATYHQLRLTTDMNDCHLRVYLDL